MTKMSHQLGRLICCAVLLVCSPLLQSQRVGSSASWKDTLQSRLPLYGHRNWIVVADSAFPVYAEPGIETIAANADFASVLKSVAGEIAASRHVRGTVFLDKEIEFVEEQDYPGVTALRRTIATTFPTDQVSSIPHSEAMSRIAQAGTNYRVPFIKTTGRIPYSSVYIRLDCGYMSEEIERKISNAMEAADKQGSQ